jgi:hypothetical protein
MASEEECPIVRRITPRNSQLIAMTVVCSLQSSHAHAACIGMYHGSRSVIIITPYPFQSAALKLRIWPGPFYCFKLPFYLAHLLVVVFICVVKDH